MRVINFAQGSLLMVAMFISYWLWALFGIHPYLSPLISVPALFALGYAVQGWLIAPLLARERAREPMSALLLTLGLALVLDNLALLFFQADFKTVVTPIGLYTQAAAAQVVLLGLFVLLLFVRPMGLLGVERR